MYISRGPRHQKVIGELGEHLVCNWLSRSGFAVQRVDFIGIDVIAHNRHKNQRLGITVKSRTRTAGKETGSVNMFSKRKNDRGKVRAACDAFACEPWIAIYVETTDFADLYLTSLRNYDDKYRGKGRTIDAWKMRERDRERYEKDPNVRHIRIDFRDTNWFECPPCPEPEGSSP